MDKHTKGKNMIEKDPTLWGISSWIFALSMPVAGGMVNWYSKVRKGRSRIFNFVELIGEIFTSGFVGLGTFMLLTSYDQPPGVCAAFAGVSGHMATRILFLIEQYIETKGKRIIEDE